MLGLLAQGLSNPQIGQALSISRRTVEHHLASVFHKRGFRSRSEVARAFALQEADEPGPVSG